MSEVRLLLVSACYGGMASAAHLKSLLAFRAAAEARNVELRLDIGGGEALASRGRASALAKFLASDATHILFTDGDCAFTPEEVFALMTCGEDPAAGEGGRPLLLVGRAAAQRVAAAYPDLVAGLGDLRGAATGRAVMVFDSLIDPGSGAYVSGAEAFMARCRAASAPK